MSCPFHGGASRRGFLTSAAKLAGGGLAGGLAAGGAAQAKPHHPPLIKTASLEDDRRLPFYGAHQNGVVTPIQAHTYFAAFDVTSDKRAELVALMKSWTQAAAKLTQGIAVRPLDGDPAAPIGDSGEVRDLPPSRLTLTFGLGPSLFAQDGVDRFGLASRRPPALVDLPRFVGDQLVPQRTGGDLSVQACSDDPQANLHAVRQLMRLADGVAKVRWVQAGFVPGYDPKVTPRNLMGFKDGTMNPSPTDPSVMAASVWSGDEGGAWMNGGAYVVVRPIRIALEHWDRMTLGFQEQTVGRRKASGAPLSAKADETEGEFTPLDLDATDKDGNPIIPENAHTRLAAPASNDGAQILRRSYGYDNGVSFVAERWPPWRQGLELDAGLLFVCYQRDPRTGFIKIFDKMSKFDMMNQFVTHVGGGLFACPTGVREGGYLAEALLEA
jgi:deferrochelatase/peroxidase EfeB